MTLTLFPIKKVKVKSSLWLFYTQVNVVNDDLNHLVQMAAANPSFGDENRKRLGYLNKTIIYTCKYNKVKCANELRWYCSFEFGNCWQFNVGYNGTNHNIEVCLLLVYSSFFITSPFITALARFYGQYFCTLCQNLIFLIFSNWTFSYYLPTVKFCGLSPVQLPNNSGAGPGTDRDIFVV